MSDDGGGKKPGAYGAPPSSDRAASKKTKPGAGGSDPLASFEERLYRKSENSSGFASSSSSAPRDALASFEERLYRKSAGSSAGAASSASSAPRDALASFEDRLYRKSENSAGPAPEAVRDDVSVPVGAHAAASLFDDSLEKARAADAAGGAARISHSDDSGVGPAWPASQLYSDDGGREKGRDGRAASAPRPDPSGRRFLGSFGDVGGDEDAVAEPQGSGRLEASARRSTEFAPPLVRSASLPQASPVPEDQVFHGFVVTDDPVYEAVMLLPDEENGAGRRKEEARRRPCWVRYNILIVFVMILVGTAINLGISLGTQGRASNGKMGEPADGGMMGGADDDGMMGPPEDDGMMGEPGAPTVTGSLPPATAPTMATQRPTPEGMMGGPDDDGTMGPPDDDGMMEPPDDGGMMGPPVSPTPSPFPSWATALIAVLGAVVLLGVPLAYFMYRRGAAAGRSSRGQPGVDGRDDENDKVTWDKNYSHLLHFRSERVVATIPKPSSEMPAGVHLASRGGVLVVRSVDPAGPYGSRGLRAGMVVRSICGVPVAGRTPPEVVAIIREAEGSVTVEAEAPGDLRGWLEGQRRLHASSGLERERAKKLIDAGVLPRPDDGKGELSMPESGLDNV